MSQTTLKFETWAIVELFGHQKIAGYCTEQNIAGANMLRVDVPETKEQPAYTRLLGNAAIYAISPVDEATARYMAERINTAPVQVWQVSEIVAKQTVTLPALTEESELYAPDYAQVRENCREVKDAFGKVIPWGPEHPDFPF